MFDSLIHRTLRGEKTARPPFWFMRQAGRYLPEYRQIRANVKDFLSLCYSPELAAEITIQPIRRFGMDAAIVFSDILVIPHAMGQDVCFKVGEGPVLAPIRNRQEVEALKMDAGHITSFLAPVAQTLRLVRQSLPPSTSLIGFCGAPWTVACYMIEGKTSRDYETARRFALEHEAVFSDLIDRIVTASVEYLSMQVEAGADILQIFDSWAGILPQSGYRKWVIEPTAALVKKLKMRHPHIPIIGFPRGSGAMLAEYAEMTEVDAVSIDIFTPVDWAKNTIAKPLQGNLDPLLLACDKQEALRQAERIIQSWKGKPFIFNLGHGILPFTPVDHVESLCELLRGTEG